MAQISVNNLTFYYDGSIDNIFEDVSFIIDTDWKLGFVGRNGRGKTTFLRLLMGEMEYKGSISHSMEFDYFPYSFAGLDLSMNSIDLIEKLCPDYELWQVCRELNLLDVDAGVLYRPFETLSNGEQTKLLLALLFSGDTRFLLIDEPTNHLDIQARQIICDYLKKKKGFILVSHDKAFLDECVDHVLVLNKTNITVEQGNFSSWWENKRRQDEYELAQNENLKKDIRRLTESARRTAEWADKVERSKIGFDPTKEHDRFLDTRAYIAEKSRRMQQRRKNLETRQQKEIQEKEGLLKNLETADDLKLFPLRHHKNVLVQFEDVSISYGDRTILTGIDFKIQNGDRVALIGANGCGKSSIIKKIMGENIHTEGRIEMAAGLKISYVCQDTSALQGTLEEYAAAYGIDGTLFRAILRKLDFERTQFDKPMESYSGGQKKKVLIARSLCEQAHLYIWDEPLNFIDIFSRMQIEKLIKEFKPTLLFVEHDKDFVQEIATQKMELKGFEKKKEKE